jgi:cytochrome P450
VLLGRFLTAGAETSATALAATVWYLSRPAYAHCLARLQDEVRNGFARYEDITGDAVAQLPYLNAVLEETMRLMPPSPIGPPRVSPGDTVDGVYVPKGVYVSADICKYQLSPFPYRGPVLHVLGCRMRLQPSWTRSRTNIATRVVYARPAQRGGPCRA